MPMLNPILSHLLNGGELSKTATTGMGSDRRASGTEDDSFVTVDGAEDYLLARHHATRRAMNFCIKICDTIRMSHV
jgi:hypothetical protein